MPRLLEMDFAPSAPPPLPSYHIPPVGRYLPGGPPTAPPPIPLERAAEVACALFEGFFTAGEQPVPPVPLSELKYLDLDQAATYSRLKRGTISNAIWSGEIEKEPGSRKVVIRREILDKYLATKRKKKKHRG